MAQDRILLSPQNLNSSQETDQFVERYFEIESFDAVRRSASDIFLRQTVPGKGQREFKKLINASSICSIQDDDTIQRLLLIKNFLGMLEWYSASYSQELTSNKSMKDFLAELFSLYSQDPDLSQSEVTELLNLFLTPEQAALYFYNLSEYQDRFSGEGSTANLLKVPPFNQFPEKFMDYLPVDDVSLVSCQLFSSFFKKPNFLPAKGNNKKILSIGIPPGLFRHLRYSRGENDSEKIRDGIVRIKIYKVDRLRPEIVFFPQQFLFEMNRFPTRIAANWDVNVLLNDNEFDIFQIPTKFLSLGGGVTLHKNFFDAFKKHLTSGITIPEFQQIYTNHATSFLLEEYINWFTDIEMNENRYYNYGQFVPIQSVKNQYKNFYNTIKNIPNTPGAVATSKFSPEETGGASEVTKSVIKTSSNKGITVDLTNTIKNYFTNETLFLDPVEHRRRISYPKKFDRVFTVIIDPDEFEIDQGNSKPELLVNLFNRGEISKSDGNKYTLKDSTQNDATFEDYFITIEPYDYVSETE